LAANNNKSVVDSIKSKEKLIQYLQAEIISLQTQIDFLKKINDERTEYIINRAIKDYDKAILTAEIKSKVLNLYIKRNLRLNKKLKEQNALIKRLKLKTKKTFIDNSH